MSKKVTKFTAITTLDDADLIPVVDTSAGEQKKITKADLAAQIGGTGVVATHEAIYNHLLLHGRVHNVDSTADHTGVTGATSGHLTMFNSDLLFADSGYTPGDFAAKVHQHVEADITDLVFNATEIKGVTVDDSSIGNGKVLAYDSGSGNIVYAAGGASDATSIKGKTVDDSGIGDQKALIYNSGSGTIIYGSPTATVNIPGGTENNFVGIAADTTLKDSGSSAASFAAAGNGVTNGDSHDHVGGDGAQIDHGGLGGLGDDDHTQYVKHSLSTAISDFLVGSGSNTWIKKTLAEVKTILGLGTAAYTAATDYVTHALATAANDFLVASGSGAYVKKTLAETKVILGVVRNDVQLQYVSTTQIQLIGLNGTTKVITVNGLELDCSTAKTVDNTDHLLAADGTDSGNTPTDGALYYVYASNANASYRASGVGLSATAHTSGYLATSGNGANWKLVGWVYLLDSGGNKYFYDEDGKRLVVSKFNPRMVRVSADNSNDHTYATASWRKWNNDDTTLVKWVQHEDFLYITAHVVGYYGATGSKTGRLGFGLDSTSAVSGGTSLEYVVTGTTAITWTNGVSAVVSLAGGYHYGYALEYGHATASLTFKEATIYLEIWR